MTIGELRYGARRLPEGQRRSALIEAIDRLVVADGDRVLPYGAEAADAYGVLRADRERAGRTSGSSRAVDCASSIRGLSPQNEQGDRSDYEFVVGWLDYVFVVE